MNQQDQLLSITPGYDPRIGSLLAQCESDWGRPEDNRKLLLPYGIRPLDIALYGIDIVNGEVLVFQGPPKRRKTTAVVNILINFMTMGDRKHVPTTVIDTLESGMNEKRYRDTILCNLATRLLLRDGHKYLEACPACGAPKCQHLGLTPDYLRYNTRTGVQASTLEEAMEIMSAWPLLLYSASKQAGNTRDLTTTMLPSDKGLSRWEYLIEEFGAKVLISDHLQQYIIPTGAKLSDYEKQILVVEESSRIVAQYKTVLFMLSQVSLTSQREAAAGTGKYTAMGGQKAEAEATSVFSVDYAPGSGRMTITLEESRKYQSFSVYQTLEDASGAFYGDATQGQKSVYREGMDDVRKAKH